MKKSIKLFVVILIFIFFCVQLAISDEKAGKIIYIKPEIEIIRERYPDPIEAKLNMILYENDVIKTYEGSEVELVLKNDIRVIINREITISIKKLLLSKDPRLRVWVESIWKKVQKLVRDTDSENISTTLAGVRGAPVENFTEGKMKIEWIGIETIEEFPSKIDIELMIENLKMIIEDNPEREKTPEALFYLAELYKELSLRSYEKLVEDYPNSKYVNEAKERIK